MKGVFLKSKTVFFFSIYLFFYFLKTVFYNCLPININRNNKNFMRKRKYEKIQQDSKEWATMFDQ